MGGLLVGELVFRLNGLAEWGQGQGPSQPSFGLSAYRINPQGFRGPEIVPADLRNRKVILGLGDSITFGQGVEWKETYLQQLEKNLNKSGRSSLRYKTINIGKPGWGTLNQAQFFFKNIQAYKPDVFILQFTLNDPEITPYHVRPFFPFWLDRILWRSHLYFYGVKLYNFRQFPYKAFIRELFEEDQPGWVRSQEALRQMGRYCRQNRIKPILIIFPMVQSLNNYKFREIHKKVKAVGEKNGFTTIDLLETYLSDPNPERSLRVSQGDWHPNGKGHKLAAEALGRVIKNRF